MDRLIMKLELLNMWKNAGITHVYKSSYIIWVYRQTQSSDAGMLFRDIDDDFPELWNVDNNPHLGRFQLSESVDTLIWIVKDKIEQENNKNKLDNNRFFIRY